MTRRGRDKAVKEPIQVYLTEPDRALLDRVAAAAGLSRAEVLRRGLRRFSAEVLADAHPVLEFLEAVREGWPADMPTDAGRKHDRYLTDEHQDAAAKPGRKSPRPRKRGSR